MEIVSEEEPGMDVDIDLEGMNLGSQRVEEDESTAGEEYSKSLGDRTFQKFVTRLERAPEQILRYSFPLFASFFEILHFLALLALSILLGQRLTWQVSPNRRA